MLRMEVTEVLHMNGGVGEESYAKNSLVQQKVLTLTKPIREEALANLYSKRLPERLVIADLGCSSGPNTFFVVFEVIRTVEKLCLDLNHQSPEYQVFLNDLPGNDFNNIFRSLGGFKKKLGHAMVNGVGHCFLAGAPGSFYGRIFPSKSLHFVHSSYSLQWLSQVPEGVENNKGNIYMASTSPSNVLKAYYHQFQRDFSLFLECRAKEVVEGGCMVLTFLGRKSDDPSSKECCLIWELMAKALNDMASVGMLKEEEVDSFNIPQYTPSPSEVEQEIQKEGSFSINRMEVSVVNWNAYDDWNAVDSEFSESEVVNDGGYNVTKCMRAVAEPLLISHFGEGIIEEVFKRYQEILTDRMSKEKIEFINVTFSMTRRA
ncbi:S-adenosyl-L-methionine:benzoic acid/salicylic acid carboxyl methyltransferase 3-like [Prosopis cineraria]|uniref:S-adenosyl-L-methionine:benzoic acid/salicylic acid carboxyl methyltransferase 3-like n=1 Tax=Prosopis cineraria TaxID=364024 RepID=UPI0024100E0B|nr:S-adenosyl-L-methionine:benzoic acid/salicylic acid carboxyl methyltransferase 3-like [Prosopis cineraria]